jgi:hypothetical protein
MRPNYSIFWVPATGIEVLERAYLEIGVLLQIPGIADDKADVKTLVKNRLSQEQAGDWLMIVDNADDVDIWFNNTSNSAPSSALIDYMPRSNKGSILFTTRYRKVAVKLAQSNVLEVFQMDKDNATDLLKKSLIHPEITDGDDQVVLQLLQKLTFLPLAIVQAAAYLNEMGISISEYLSLFEGTDDNTIAILSEDFEDDWRYQESKNPVAMTWLISFEQIQRYNLLAADYLSFMSCVGPNGIPKSLLPLA